MRRLPSPRPPGRQVPFRVEDYWRATVTGESPGHVEQVGHGDMGRAFNRHAYRVRLQSVVRALDRAGWNPHGQRVFDAGYGVGYYLDHWERAGIEMAAGVDVSERAQHYVQQRFPAFDLRVGVISDIDAWPDWYDLQGTFSLVTAIDVLYHVVDEEQAARSLGNLARLVAPKALLLVTDKFTGLASTRVESGIVVRRPLRWYENCVRPQGLRLVGTFPMMWCMDPPVTYGGLTGSWLPARILWIAMRAPLKYLPPNSRVQNGIGHAVGSVGRAIDSAVLPRLDETPNLSIALFRRDG